ncbi:hypothetical protein DL95DRAFT_529444 [Leptodontidium sp. 2 PMI_412]|nr:hypothetical protein DL95DRAFT_529444 [Leptodontidium sp. 2 PMI_412]
MLLNNVAVIGASGNVGTPIVKALLDAGFTVTAIARLDSTSTYPAGVEVRKANLHSLDDVAKAFLGQDAVVSTIATSAVGGQDVFADAAIVAGVKRYIPSEFGINTRKLQGEVLGKMLKSKIAHVDYLIEKAKSYPSFTWTGLATGLFFDWGLNFGTFGLSLKNKSIRILDSGNELVSTSSLSYVGKAVAAILTHEAETANKYIEMAEFTTSQNQILTMFEEERGTKFTVTNAKTADIEKAAHSKLSSGDHSSFVDFLLVYNFRDGNGHPFCVPEETRKALGLAEGDLKRTIKEYIRSSSI